MPVVRFLVDTSAWIRYPEPEVGARLDELSAAGVLASCGVVELQLLGALRDRGTYATVAALRGQAFSVLEMSEADLRRALEVQALLGERGEHGVPWPTLLVAAVAERCGVRCCIVMLASMGLRRSPGKGSSGRHRTGGNLYRSWAIRS
jgi:predicted nucleic acid-binding protein